MTSHMIRVSCSAPVRLVTSLGQFALLLNKRQLELGKRVLAPIGGVIEAHEGGMDYLRNYLGATDFEKGNDLRFRLPRENAQDFVDWLIQQRNRELTPDREIIEELTDENKVLSLHVLGDMTTKRIGYGFEIAESTRKGYDQPEETLRIAEVFELTLGREARALLGRSLFPTEFLSDAGNVATNHNLVGVSRTEILQGHTDGQHDKIATISKLLLFPKPEITLPDLTRAA